MYINKQDKTMLEIFKCAGCGKLYRHSLEHGFSSCCTIHSEGDCCHFSDKEVTDAQWSAIMDIVTGVTLTRVG